MSMLAGPKIKQRWSLNPRGKIWSDDSNKFGQKMLEKMGWSKGKGLGSKENGMVDHVKLPYKNDSKGIGYKENDNQWTEHDDKFSSLLRSLSGEEPPQNEIKLSSLELKSQSSKARLHYKKFTRGKDLSGRSEKDLACIFGKKSLTDMPKKKEEDGFTRNGGNMVDYFKKKLPNYSRNNGYVVGSNGVLKKESDSEEESLGFGFNSGKRKMDEEICNGTPKRKKTEEDAKGLSNPAFDPLFKSVDIQKTVLNTIQEEESEERKKADEQNESDKKKSKKNSFEADASGIEENTTNVKRKKKKKREEMTVDNIQDSFDVQTSFDSSVENQKMKKKKKKKHDLAAIDNPIFNNEDNENESSLRNDNFEVKRKKKKDKNLSAIDNPSFNVADEENSQNGTFEVKRKNAKRKNDSLGLDNPNFDDLNEGSLDTCQNNDFEVRRKKKKNENDSLALDNPNFDISDCQNGFIDSNFEVKRKNKKKKNKNDMAIDNPNFEDYSNNSVVSQKEEKNEEIKCDFILNVTSTPTAPKPTPKKSSSAKRRKSVRFSDINEERIIPNIDLENRIELFDINSKVIADGLRDANSTKLNLSENMAEFSKKIDGFQAEIENDINEAKMSKYIGEVGNPDGENEKVPDGTKLKFKFAKFRKSAPYEYRDTTRAKTSYKHLIKGDIILGFNNTNLHEIVGYGVKDL